MPLLEVLGNRRGVCQDFAHIMIGALRSLRLPARYISGYLRSGADYQGAEASHAWVSVFVPGSGWLSFDPTNDMIPSDAHVTLAWGRGLQRCDTGPRASRSAEASRRWKWKYAWFRSKSPPCHRKSLLP